MPEQRLIEITVGQYRNDKSWQRKKLIWDSFAANMAPDGKWFKRTDEKYKEYLKLPKDRQDEIKDVGGFVGGILTGGRRQKKNVIGRTMVTLDIDHMTPEQGLSFWKLFRFMYDCAAVLYSTHKHSADTPRYRLIIPLNRIVTVEEYQAIARRIAGEMGIDQFDHTGFQEERLMYFPSCSKDGAYVYKVQEGPFLRARDVLDSYGLGVADDLEDEVNLTGWQDSSQWPVCEREKKKINKDAEVQGNPLDKPGLIGAFCRAYPIPDAIEKFLHKQYSPVDGIEDRYTYEFGSTSAGAIVYRDEEGNPVFLYSHHGTDPISEQLVNAFDLVRIHKFGAKDEKHDADTPVTQLPSYQEMREYATRNPKVREQIMKDKRERGLEAFREFEEAEDGEFDIDAIPGEKDHFKAETGLTRDEDRDRSQKGKKVDPDQADINDEEDEDTEWAQKLDVSDKGIRSTIANVVLILENDPWFKGRLWYDEFRSRYVIRGKLPWRRVKDHNCQFTDEDNAALRHYLEKVYGISGVQKIDDGMRTLMTRQKFHPVKDMLRAHTWDGQERIDRLLIDYLGAEDTPYVRTVTRKTLVAAVTRIMRPGVKFDNVLVLVGEEGKMKSMLFDHLANPWFSDSLTTIQGKEAFEQLHGYWIIEMGELSALNRADSLQIKSYLAKRVDSYRAPYGRAMIDYPRSNIFVASTNEERFLRGIGGDRRFWPVMVDIVKPLYGVATLGKDRELVGQIWAEALQAFRDGEPIFLDDKMFKTAKAVQEEHTVKDGRSATVKEYLDMVLPENWYDLELPERRAMVKGETEVEGKQKTIEREKVCVREIWVECFGKPIGDLERKHSDAITHIMNHMPGWKKAKNAIRIPGVAGTQVGWIKDRF